MRLYSFVFAIAFTILGCSAESAPDNAAGSIKQAPVEAEKVKAVEGLITEDGEAEAAKGEKIRNSNGPDCSKVKEDICPNGSLQKFCSCNGPMKQPSTYRCGCKSASGSGIKTPEISGAEG